ncbi:UDP-glycosyltransferase UGT5-like isoform X1 [Zophobas morio]|uniref:UDP-glycosyltransferase UGT5-like isoform X1 n=1 Tax=Zophobas morio TaxID=2755281 RepID=UPI003082EFE1
MKTFFALVFLVIFHLSKCAKILGVFPMPTSSHYILGSALMKGLAEHGHDVTVISPFVEKNPPKMGSYRQIELTGFLETHEIETERLKQRSMFDMEDVNSFLVLPIFFYIIGDVTEATLKHPNVQELLRSDEKFDAVIIQEFMNEAHKGFATHFNAPMILLSPIGACAWVNTLVANPAPTSYVPDAMLSYSSQMTFTERLTNTVFHFYTHILYHLFNFPKHARLYNEYFPNSVPFYDALYNVSLVFLNSHPSLNQPVPYVPNMVDIGGFHINPTKELPHDLQQFLDDSKEGVIYFSMGSNLKSAEFPPEKRDAFLNTFSKMKMKILWKWEEDVLPGQPKNVKLGKWLPQQDILAHPNVKLFMTHGGLLSTTETIYHGVPVLAIPIAGDQKLNAQRIVNEGFGLSLGYKEISEQTLTEKLDELLNNPKYTRNAKKRSELFHDRLVGPMETAVYWVEYVIRHKGAPHLKVAGVDLPWYKYMLLDVGVFILVVLLLSLYIFCKISKKIFSLCSKSKVQKVKRS